MSTSDQCAEPGCHRPRWTDTVRGEIRTLSDFCAEHTHVPMFDAPVIKPAAKVNPAAVFRKEVARQRRERENSEQ